MPLSIINVNPPCTYGFSSVIFNHPVFQPHVAALSKLVIFSSFMHQVGFVLFSSLDFAIGTVHAGKYKVDIGGRRLSGIGNDWSYLNLFVLFGHYL
jgi:hypothetical protein